MRPLALGRRWTLVGATVLLALSLRCAPNPPPNVPPPPPGATPPPATATAPAPPPPAATSSAGISEERFLELEDRRAFDETVLGAAAASGSAEIRARAALALGRIGDERAVPLLRRLLRDGSPEVRASAAFASGLLGEADLVGALAPLLSDSDGAVAARAAWSLSALESPAGQDALLHALDGASAERRPALLRALWRYSTTPAIDAALARASDPGSDRPTRAAALFALARRPYEASRPVLAAALADPATDADTAALCARALGILGRPESIAPLWAGVGDARFPVRTASLLALAAALEKTPGASLPEDAPARLVALSSDTNPSLAVPALALLRWAVADRDVFRRLWSVASSGRGRRQQVALVALMGGLREKSKDLVDTAIVSPDPFLRGAVAESLGLLPPAEADARRPRLFADGDAYVRMKVLEGLHTEPDASRNGEIIARAPSDPDSSVRAAAVDAQALFGKPSLGEIRNRVVDSYSRPDPDVAIEAIAAAEAHFEDPSAREIVEAAYRHPSVLVSRLARRSLVRKFHADPASYPWRTYDPKSPDDYARAAALESETALPVVRVETERGTLVLRLLPREAPLTVQNFLTLARRGYFDGVRIHRVAPGFVVQDGDPTGTGNGGPGYEIRDELSATPYETGTVGMALAGPDTGGSQWFVTLAPEPHLDGAYTVFGKLVAGLEIAVRIEQGDRIVRVSVPPERAP